jgi:hypothetical protein
MTCTDPMMWGYTGVADNKWLPGPRCAYTARYAAPGAMAHASMVSSLRARALLVVCRLTTQHFPQCHLVGEALDEDRAPHAEYVHGGDRSPSCGASAPAGVPLAKGIRPLGRQCHRPSSNTASLGGQGVKGRLVP